MNLLVTIERHLRRRAVPPSRFGREATGDPRFVFDLRRGREPRPHMAARVLGFIAHSEAASPAPVPVPTPKPDAAGAASVAKTRAVAGTKAWHNAAAAARDVA
jgi:hypothetical protein